ncbi:family 16 glycosylhydrolase [Changchengzhania lutea]|uniref:family 16 glycosylhydrolase n=1 Tax=Changchengzhania lutea TaxID=2049305 RepID=UPI001FEBDA1F|nr:family 16 glycosylhydrolase [Changchengzhania lutea]
MKFNYLKASCFIYFIFQLSFGQQMPIDFSDSADNFSVWGGSSFSTRQSPTDSNNPVGQFEHAASTGGQGFYIDLSSPIDLELQKTITLSFYAFDPNVHTIGLKLERGTNSDIQVDLNMSSENAWTLMTFDFSTVGGTGEYSRLTIIIDDGIATPRTYLIDDIDDGSTPTDPNAIDVEYTDLVWADEFNESGKNAINATNWFHQTQLPGGGSWFNNEEQHYTNRIENSFVESGFLNIVAIKESFADQGETKQYTSARLNSKYAFTYGRVDVRAKLPSGDGTWPAIWTLGKNINEDGGYWDNQGFGTTSWPACGEIDIMEHGLGTVNHTSSALHTPSSSGNTSNTASQEISDVANNFHIYSVNWSPNQITFLVDGVGFYTYNPTNKNSDTWPFDKDQYILLNIAMGGVAGTIDSNFTESSMVIDYVRVYQNSGLGTNEIRANEFKIFPNPASDTIKIVTNEIIDSVRLYSILGNLIMSKSESTHVIDVSGLTPGVYVLNVNSGSKRTTKKIVVN